MIQWCEDCRHDYAHDDWDAEYCQKCLDESKPGKMPIGYEQEEQENE